MADINFNGNNSTVIITGCSSGIGKATAELAKKSGFKVVGLDRNAPQTNLVDSFVQADLGTTDGIRTAMETLSKTVTFRPNESYYLVNNAGVQYSDHTALTMPANRTSEILNVCAIAPFELSKWFINSVKTLEDRLEDASIVNVGSIQAMSGIYGNSSPYNVAKAAVHGITRTVADAAAQVGVKVRANTLHPGAINTPGMGVQTKEWAEIIAKSCPSGRSGRPEEVAQAIISLMLETYTNSSQRLIDGGIAERPVRPVTYPLMKFKANENPDTHLLVTA